MLLLSPGRCSYSGRVLLTAHTTNPSIINNFNYSRSAVNAPWLAESNFIYGIKPLKKGGYEMPRSYPNNVMVRSKANAPYFFTAPDQFLQRFRIDGIHYKSKF